MATLIEDVISSVDGDVPVTDLRICQRASAVWSRGLGLASTLPRVHHRHEEGEPGYRRLKERSAGELAGLALSDDSTDASLGMAALNSLLAPDEASLIDANAIKLIFEHGRDRAVTVVGHFPFVERLKRHVRDLWVLELWPRGDDLPASEAGRVIPRSDVVAITGTTLINHTLEELLTLARDKVVILLGPSTPMTPVLFDYGIDAVCGSLVVDPRVALECVSEAVPFRYCEGLRQVCMLSPSLP